MSEICTDKGDCGLNIAFDLEPTAAKNHIGISQVINTYACGPYQTFMKLHFQTGVETAGE
jgi:hypothetical protein